MSRRPKSPIEPTRIIIPTPEEQAAEAERAFKAVSARLRAMNKSLLKATGGKAIYNPCADMLAPAARPGADDALAIPSRINDRLYYRDGRVVEMVVSN